MTRSREQHSSGRHGTAKISAKRSSELASAHPGIQPSIDIDLAIEKLLDYIPIETSGVESPGAEHAAQ
eukprot:7512634-Pyramimonas_sp.AAC.1